MSLYSKKEDSIISSIVFFSKERQPSQSQSVNILVMMVAHSIVMSRSIYFLRYFLFQEITNITVLELILKCMKVMMIDTLFLMLLFFVIWILRLSMLTFNLIIFELLLKEKYDFVDKFCIILL